MIKISQPVLVLNSSPEPCSVSACFCSSAPCLLIEFFFSSWPGNNDSEIVFESQQSKCLKIVQWKEQSIEWERGLTTWQPPQKRAPLGGISSRAGLRSTCLRDTSVDTAHTLESPPHPAGSDFLRPTDLQILQGILLLATAEGVTFPRYLHGPYLLRYSGFRLQVFSCWW